MHSVSDNRGAVWRREGGVQIYAWVYDFTRQICLSRKNPYLGEGGDNRSWYSEGESLSIPDWGRTSLLGMSLRTCYHLSLVPNILCLVILAYLSTWGIMCFSCMSSKWLLLSCQESNFGYFYCSMSFGWWMAYFGSIRMIKVSVYFNHTEPLVLYVFNWVNGDILVYVYRVLFWQLPTLLSSAILSDSQSLCLEHRNCSIQIFNMVEFYLQAVKKLIQYMMLPPFSPTCIVS